MAAPTDTLVPTTTMEVLEADVTDLVDEEIERKKFVETTLLFSVRHIQPCRPGTKGPFRFVVLITPCVLSSFYQYAHCNRDAAYRKIMASPTNTEIHDVYPGKYMSTEASSFEQQITPATPTRTFAICTFRRLS